MTCDKNRDFKKIHISGQRAVDLDYCRMRDRSIDSSRRIPESALTTVGRPCTGYRKPHWLTELLSLLSRLLRPPPSSPRAETRYPSNSSRVKCPYIPSSESSAFPRNGRRTVWSDELSSTSAFASIGLRWYNLARLQIYTLSKFCQERIIFNLRFLLNSI